MDSAEDGNRSGPMAFDEPLEGEYQAEPERSVEARDEAENELSRAPTFASGDDAYQDDDDIEEGDFHGNDHDGDDEYENASEGPNESADEAADNGEESGGEYDPESVSVGLSTPSPSGQTGDSGTASGTRVGFTDEQNMEAASLQDGSADVKPAYYATSSSASGNDSASLIHAITPNCAQPDFKGSIAQSSLVPASTFYQAPVLVPNPAATTAASILVPPPVDVTAAYESRIAEDPRGDMDAWLGLIAEQRNRGKTDDVRSVYNRFLKVFPQAVRPHDLFQLANALLRKT